MSALRCYCCGKDLGDRFVLVGYGDGADRVFVMTEACALRTEDNVTKTLVQPVYTAVPIGHNKARCPCKECRAYRKAEADSR